MAMMNGFITYLLLLLHPNLIANQVKIVSLGGMERIIKAMSTHKDHSGVQEKACGALLHLACNDGMGWCRSCLTHLFFSLDFILVVAIPIHRHDE
jgi:hypothetical protein